MKNLSNLMYVLGIGSLTLSISCGSNHKDEAKKSPEVEQNVTNVNPTSEAPEAEQNVTNINPTSEAPAEEIKPEEDLAEVIPTQESIDSFSNQFANGGAVAGSLIGSAIDSAADSLAQGTETANLYIETAGDLTVREILEQYGQSFNDYVKTPTGYVFQGAQSVTSNYFSSLLNFYGLDQ